MIQNTRVYLVSMGVYWLGFGLTTMFAPRLMDLFQTAEGVAANTSFSDHVWFHCGLDIVALCLVLFALAGQEVSPRTLRAVAGAAFMPAVAITVSVATTSWWNPLFLGAGLGCAAFGAWGLALATRSGAGTIAEASPSR